MHFIHFEYRSIQQGCAYHAHQDIHEIDCYYYGTGFHRTDGRNHPVNGPTIIYNAPGTEHLMQADGSDTIRFYHIHFTADTKERRLLKAMSPRLTAGVPVDNEMITVFSGLERRVSSGDPHQKRAAEIFLSGLLHDLYARLQGSEKPELNHHVEQARLLLKQGLYRKLDMDTLAGELHLEKSYMIRLFKRHTGTTPVQYLLKMKIDSAVWQLRNTDRQIREIAERYCFTNEFYFSRVFKRFTGLSPREFRASPSPILI